MLFPKQRAKWKIGQSKTPSTVYEIRCFSPKSGKLQIAQSKIALTNGTQGGKLFSQKRAKLKIAQSKIVLTVHWIQCYFPKNEEDLNHPVKNSINCTQDIMLFSPEKGKN